MTQLFDAISSNAWTALIAVVLMIAFLVTIIKAIGEILDVVILDLNLTFNKDFRTQYFNAVKEPDEVITGPTYNYWGYEKPEDIPDNTDTTNDDKPTGE